MFFYFGLLRLAHLPYSRIWLIVLVQFLRVNLYVNVDLLLDPVLAPFLSLALIRNVPIGSCEVWLVREKWAIVFVFQIVRQFVKHIVVVLD